MQQEQEFEPAPPLRPSPRDRVLFIILLALPSLFYLRPLLHDAIPNFMDTVMYFFPLRVHAAHLLGRGDWPLWNRSIMAGMPLFENPQSALAYPLNWPFFVWPGAFWFTFPMTLQLGLFGALTAWALRRMGVSRWPAAWAGAMALAGSYGWSRFQFGNYLNVLPWWPLWIGAASAFVYTRRLRWILFGSLAVAFSLLGGAHQLAFYGLTALALVTAVQLMTHSRSRVRWLFYSFMTFTLGLAIGAPGWLPQLRFLAETSRPGGLAPDQVLAGTIGSWGELVHALVGDWPLVHWRPGAAWSDAESSAAIGLLALVLAGVFPRRKPLRRIWIGCWVAALVSILLSLRVVMEPLLKALPVAGIFHDPRRWLGVTHWLILLNAAIGASSLWSRKTAFGEGPALESEEAKATPSVSPRRLLRLLPGILLFLAAAIPMWLALLSPPGTDQPGPTAAALVTALAATLLTVAALALGALTGRPWSRRLSVPLLLLGLFLTAHTTWVTTDLKTTSAQKLMHPKREPLIFQGGLHPGQRFFTLDWSRSASYDYARPDLTDWALPNLAMLWDIEDLGGYEPAQSVRYRLFMKDIHANEPWRQPYAQHFGLVQAPLAKDALDAANIRAALFPRWGLPMFFTQHDLGQPPQALFPRIFSQNFPVRLLFANGVTSSGAELAVKEDGNLWRYPLKNVHPISAEDDLVAPPRINEIKRPQPAGAGRLLAAEGEIPPLWGKPTLWFASLPTHARLVDVFVWGPELRALWQPVKIEHLATLMRYQGEPSWLGWRGAQGTILDYTIRSGRLDLKVDVIVPTPHGVAQAPYLIIHDAWWPGWQARLDNRPAPIIPYGLWRALAISPGRHTVTMVYNPPWIRTSLIVMGVALAILLILCVLLPLMISLTLRDRRPQPDEDSIIHWGY